MLFHGVRGIVSSVAKQVRPKCCHHILHDSSCPLLRLRWIPTSSILRGLLQCPGQVRQKDKVAGWLDEVNIGVIQVECDSFIFGDMAGLEKDILDNA